MRLILTILTACLALAGSLALFGPMGTAYGALCAVCCFLAWCDVEWRAVGLALTLGWSISNVIFLVGSPEDRPAIYSGVEVLVLMSAFVCWFSGRYVVAARFLAVVSFVSIICNIILASSSFHWADVNAHELRTNITFAIECLIVGVVGVTDRDYFNRLRNYRHHSVTNHVHLREADDR